MNKWLLLLFVSVVAWLQIYFFGALGGGYLAVNLVVIVVAAIAVGRSLSVGLSAAILGGFWLEAVSTTDYGARMIFLALLVMGIHAFKRLGFLIDRRGLFVMVCSIGSLLYSTWLLMWTWLDIGEISWPSHLWVVLVTEMVIVVAISFISFKRLNKLIVSNQYG